MIRFKNKKWWDIPPLKMAYEYCFVGSIKLILKSNNKKKPFILFIKAIHIINEAIHRLKYCIFKREIFEGF